MSETIQQPQNQEVNKEQEKAYNFEQLRKKLEATEKEKLAAQTRIAEFEKQIKEAQNKKFREPDVDEEPYDEPYVDQRLLNKKFEKFEERFGKKIDEVAEQKARSIVEQQRNAEFLKNNADFSQVLSPEIVEKFATQHPEIAEPMLEMPDGFARQKLLYQAIKLSGLHKPPVPKPTIQETIDSKRRGAFYQQPSGSSPPYSQVGDFSDTGKKSAYEKVQQLKKQLRI